MLYLVTVILWTILLGATLVSGHDKLVSGGWLRPINYECASWISAFFIALIPLFRAYEFICLLVAINISKKDYENRRKRRKMMTFNLNIDAKELFGRYDYEEYSEEDFKRNLKEEVIEEIASQILYNELGYHQTVDQVKDLSYQISKKVDKFLDDHGQEIVKLIVDRVSAKIERKKYIVEMTPKARELAAADKDNEAYFEEMIEKAIAKKFMR